MHLKKQTMMTVNIWTTVLILIIVCVKLPFYVLASQRFRENALFWTGIIFKLWLAVLACVICANIVTLILMNRILQMRRGSKVSSGHRECYIKMNELIRRIRKAAGCFVILGAVLSGLAAYNLPLFERTYYSSPACYVDTYYLAFRFGVFFWILLFTTGLWFVAPILASKIQTIGEAGTRKRPSQIRGFLPSAVRSNSAMLHSEELAYN
jgi:hypothetical protein